MDGSQPSDTGSNPVGATNRSSRSPESGQNISLVGYRGSGKSTLGRRLAETLRLPFFDLDREIEQAHGRSIREMFEEDGEAWFREVEADTLGGILLRAPLVLAPGGGAVVSPENRRLLRERSFVIYLEVDEIVLWQRLRGGSDRPPLTALGHREEIRRLLQERRKWYAEVADRVLTVSGEEAVDATFARLQDQLR